MISEAELERTEYGLAPRGEGWYVVNLRDAEWRHADGRGAVCVASDDFEGWRRASDQLGVNVFALSPGEPMALYHREADQEGFLVLSGEAVLVVEGQERRLRQWDYFHCPPGTDHITIGAGEQGAAIFMLGTRSEGHRIHYPANPVAARHGASVAESTDRAQGAYKDRPPIRPSRPPAPWG